MRHFYICFFFCVIGLTLAGQEVCDNGIDDDGNGLVDLNDPGCPCDGIFIPADVTDKIPNPSFENFNCCPNGPSQMDCTKGWIQATSGTSDYFHTCGYLFVPMVEAGLVPFPDGDGCSGTIYSDGWKEYIASCLTAPLLAGKKYDLRLQIASTPIAADGSSCNNGVIYYPPVEVTFFGNANCLFSPLATYDCPSVVDPGWQVIGTGYYDPQAAWGELTLSLEPAFTVNALMIGPPCVLPPGYGSGAPCYPYFYYDNLILEELQPVDGLNVILLGEPCEDNLELLAWVDHTGGEWQWYLDGVALFGENTDALSISQQHYSGGTYTVRYSFNGGCITANIDVDLIEIEPTFVDLMACPGNTSVCAGEEFDDEGVYEVVLPSWQGCDSVVYCIITYYPEHPTDTLHVATCAMDTIQICNHMFDSTGLYVSSCFDRHGCDSIVVLDLVILSPKAVIDPPDTLDCLSKSTIQLHASGSAYLADSLGSTGYSWTGPPGGIVSNPDSIVIAVSLPGQYCVIQTQESFGIACADTSCVVVLLTSEPPPVPLINWPTSICLGDSILVSTIPKSSDSTNQMNWTSSPGITLIVESDSSAWLIGEQPGFGTACAFIQSTCGTSDSTCQQITVLSPDSVQVVTYTCDSTQAGISLIYAQNIQGCDSVILLETLWKPSYESSVIIPTCDPTQTGLDTVWLATQFGCDSLIIFDYDLTAQVQTNVEVNICGPGVDHIDTIVIQSGLCDSLVITRYAYNLPDLLVLSSATCQKGNAGKDTLYLVNQAGCDSLVIHDIWYAGSDTMFVQAQTCDSNQTGIFIDVLIGQYCDSVVVTEVNWSASLLSADTVYDCLGNGVSTDTIWLQSWTGCDSLHIRTTISSELSAAILLENETCWKKSDGQILVDVPGGGLPPFQYRLSGGSWQSEPVFDDLPPGVYSVDLKDAGGCTRTYSGLSIGKGQQVFVYIGPDKLVPPGTIIDLSIQTNELLQIINWSATDVMSCASCLQTQIGPVTVNQLVIVEVMTPEGCEGSDQMNISIFNQPRDSVRVYIPNSFSPNGDGINDVFSIYGNDQVVAVRQLAIYDRWGNALYSRSDLPINDPSAGWDGTFREEIMDPGVYVFVVEVELKNGDIRLYKGDVTVVR